METPAILEDSERRGAERSEAPRSGEASKIQRALAPDPQVAAKPTRRRFTSEFKLQLLREADQCGPGELGALLRRHGLYSSHLSVWRRERDLGARERLSKKRGRKAAERNPLSPRIAQLERENRRLQARLRALHERLGSAQPTREYAPAPSALDSSCNPLLCGSQRAPGAQGQTAPSTPLWEPCRPTSGPHLTSPSRAEEIGSSRQSAAGTEGSRRWTSTHDLTVGGASPVTEIASSSPPRPTVILYLIWPGRQAPNSVAAHCRRLVPSESSIHTGRTTVPYAGGGQPRSVASRVFTSGSSMEGEQLMQLSEVKELARQRIRRALRTAPRRSLIPWSAQHTVQPRGPALHERFGPAQPTREYAPAPGALVGCNRLLGACSGLASGDPSLPLP